MDMKKVPEGNNKRNLEHSKGGNGIGLSSQKEASQMTEVEEFQSDIKKIINNITNVHTLKTIKALLENEKDIFEIDGLPLAIFLLGKIPEELEIIKDYKPSYKKLNRKDIVKYVQSKKTIIHKKNPSFQFYGDWVKHTNKKLNCAIHNSSREIPNLSKFLMPSKNIRIYKMAIWFLKLIQIFLQSTNKKESRIAFKQINSLLNSKSAEKALSE